MTMEVIMKNAMFLFVFTALSTVGYTQDNTGAESWEQKAEPEVEAVGSAVEAAGEKIASEVESAAEHVHH